MANPYNEIINEKEGYVLREFSCDTPSFEYVWHRDKEDRYIQATHNTDWKFQLDNEFPQELTKNKLFIPKETYHRIIKGTGDLTLKIKELWIVIVKYVHVKSAIVTAAVAVN